MSEENMLIGGSGFIQIAGADGSFDTWTKTSGIAVLSDRIHFAGLGREYIRIPYQNTPYPLYDNCVIVLDFRVNAFTYGSESVPLGRWTNMGAGGDWAVCYNASTKIKMADLPYTGNTLRRETNMVVPFGQRAVLTFRFEDGVRSHYLNGVLKEQFSAAKSAIATDWVIGTYNGGSVPTTEGNGYCDWDLFKLSIKFLD